MRTHLIHRPARDIMPPLGGARVCLLSDLILHGFHAAAAAGSATLQTKAGYINARPLATNSSKPSCYARPDHTYGSFASNRLRPRHVCLSPNRDRRADIQDRQLRATTGHRWRGCARRQRRISPWRTPARLALVWNARPRSLGDMPGF